MHLSSKVDTETMYMICSRKFKVATALLITFMSACGALAAEVPVKPASVRTVVAKVNGKAIYLDELDPHVKQSLQRYKKAGSRKISPGFLKLVKMKELDKLIDIELLAQAGARMANKDLEEKVEARIKSMSGVPSHGESSPPDKDNSQLREGIRKNLLVDEYLKQQGVNDLQVPDHELKTFYDNNKASFAVPEMVKASHILVAMKGSDKEKGVEEARNKIESIRDEIRKGGNFAELAKKNSDCSTARNGGDLGYIQAGYMPRDFSDVAFALKPGDISEPIRTQYGFHIVKVFEKKPARISDFSEVKDAIAKLLVKDYQRKRADEILVTLKQKASIETYLNDVQ